MSKRGRPAIGEKQKRAALVQARVSEKELADLKRAAAREDRKLSDWLRHVAVNAAKQEG